MGWGQAGEGGLGKLSPPPPWLAHLYSEKWKRGTQRPCRPAKEVPQVGSLKSRVPGGKFQEGFHLSGGGGKELAFMKFLLRLTGGLPGVAWVPGDRQK